ncbi:MAG: AAA-like domain-containing protein [Cyanobacteria bacterium P01_D01_bin.105]
MPLSNIDAVRLNFVDQLVSQGTDHSLTDLQRLLLSECWQMSHKTYDEIAESCNYSGCYIQRRVAPELWRLMSEVVGVKVTKSNCKSVIFRYLEEQEDLQRSLNQAVKVRVKRKGYEASELIPSESESNVSQPSFPLLTESLALDSPFYIQRDCEAKCCQLITQPGALIRIKSPKQTGKTSLMNRIIDAASDYPAITLNFQQVEQESLSSLDKLLRWICANISHRLKRSHNLDDVWNKDIGSKMNCTLHLEEFVLESIDTPIILAIEESSRLFDYPEVAQEFYAMLRTWHEYTQHQGVWQKLRLILVESTESYVSLDINTSPFDLGVEVALTPFNHAQVSALAQCYGLALSNTRVEKLTNLLGGHPYLTQVMLHYIAKKSMDWEELFETAGTDEGIFHHHLHRHLANLKRSPDLAAALKQVIEQTEPVRIGQKEGFKLHSMGLVKLEKNNVRISCQLYRQYFRERL